MLRKAKLAVCYEINTQVLCDHYVEFSNVKPGGMYSYR
jgi:hypothetical protein